MTPKESIRFAGALSAPDTIQRLESAREALAALEQTASDDSLRRARDILLRRAESYRHADCPGHSIWYEHHLRAAACASLRWWKALEGTPPPLVGGS